MSLIEKEEFKQITNLDKYKLGGAAGLLMRLMRLRKLNKVYKSLGQKEGVDFLNACLDELSVNLIVDQSEAERLPEKGSFITVSNHPFGLIDGLLLLKLVTQRRPEFRVMANPAMKRLDPIAEFFISTRHENEEERAQDVGIGAGITHLETGKPLGLFPAGEVSGYRTNGRLIIDREWQLQYIKLIKRAEVPVVPVYFNGNNSAAFHLLGMVHPKLKTATMANELFRKKNADIKVRIGTPISPSDQKEFKDLNQFGRYLRARTYALGSALEVKKFYRLPKVKLPKKPAKIVDPVPQQVLIDEVNKLRKEECLLHQHNNFEIFIAYPTEMPHVLNELGRLREVTFRAVGEGTNKRTDLDEYDLYFHHLFIWDTREQRIVGSYRMGKGDEILEKFGMSGFYIDSLFKIDKRFQSTLGKSIELGRSFIRQEYQARPLPLFLLWKGILHFLLNNTEYRYLIGPVSISNMYSRLSQGLMVEFIRANHFDHELARLVSPRKRFKADLSKYDTDKLLTGSVDMKKLDKIIRDIEPTNFSVPVLLKKYISLHAKIICFNIDPKFGNALDGLMLLDLKDVPQETIDKIKRELAV